MELAILLPVLKHTQIFFDTLITKEYHDRSKLGESSLHKGSVDLTHFGRCIEGKAFERANELAIR